MWGQRNSHALCTEGLFRLSSSAEELKAIKLRFDNDGDADVAGASVHAVANLLKAYLREMPSPLLSHSRYFDIVHSQHHRTAAAKAEALCQIIQQLTPIRRRLLSALVQLCRQVALFSDDNKMPLPNLMIVLMPNILRAPADDILTEMANAKEGSEAIMMILQGFHIDDDLNVYITTKEGIDKAVSEAEAVHWRQVDELETAVLVDPTDITKWRQLGATRFMRGLSSAAIEAYTRALELDPQSYEVRLEMAVIYEEMGERALAKDSYKESARLKPESVQVMQSMTSFLDKNGLLPRESKEMETSVFPDPRFR